MADKSNFAGRGDGEWPAVDGKIGRRLLFAFRRVKRELVDEALRVEDGERIVAGPVEVFDGAIEGGGEIARGAGVGGQDPKVMRNGAVVAGGGEADPFPGRRNADRAKRSVRGAKFFLCTGERDEIDAVGEPVGEGVISSFDDEALAIGHPGQLFNFPVGAG